MRYLPRADNSKTGCRQRRVRGILRGNHTAATDKQILGSPGFRVLVHDGFSIVNEAGPGRTADVERGTGGYEPRLMARYGPANSRGDAHHAITGYELRE